MTSRLALLLLALLPMAACTAQDAAAPTAAPSATAAVPVAPTPASAPTAAAATPAEATSPAPVGVADRPASGPLTTPASQAVAAGSAAIAAASGPALVAGTDYVVIEGGQPFDPANGKIEVVEVFGYTCPHCASFQPLVNAWKAKLPADVRFTYVPAPFGGYWIPYAKAFYAAESMGVLGRSHDAVFQALHLDRTLPIQGATPQELGKFYARFGADAKTFASNMQSFAVDAKVSRAKQFIQRSGVDATPMMMVNGRYRVQGRTLEDSLRIVNLLIAQERAAKSGR